MANTARTIYVGMTNDPVARVLQHKQGVGSAFTAKYALTRLVYLEEVGDPYGAICREKQLKGWVRRRKLALIESANPGWVDLAEDWYDQHMADPSLRSG
jgi:putative endonuclease